MATKWTPELERSFASAWKSGVPIELIQKRFHIGQETVEKTRRRLALLSRSPRPVWTEEREQTVRTLWIAGKSAAEIAKIMAGGLTRNAVISKVHRLGLSQQGRAASAKPAPDMRKRVFKAPKVPRSYIKPPKPGPQNKPALIHGIMISDDAGLEVNRAARRAHGQTAVEFVESGAGVQSPNARPFMEATRGCKWPLGQGAAISYCCNPPAGGDGFGRTYCAGHVAVATDARQPRRVTPGMARHFTKHERVENARPAAANNNGTAWDLGRAA